MLEASEAKTHADTVFVTRDLDLSPSDPKINGFPGLIVEHLYVTFGDPSRSGC